MKEITELPGPVWAKARLVCDDCGKRGVKRCWVWPGPVLYRGEEIWVPEERWLCNEHQPV